MKMVVLAALFVLVLATACAAEWNVKDSGAVGDGVTDDTAAFQKALDQAGAAGGGIVNVPAGRYAIRGNLSIPASTTLQGVFRVPPTTSGGTIEGLGGTILQAYAGRGSQEGPPFIKLAGSCATVAGLSIVYPEWKQTDVPPVPYPPCIESSGTENVGVLDCLLVNPYEGIKFVRAHRHLIRNVYGYPIKRGLVVDQCYDIGRVENIHYWPFGVTYRPEDPYCKWINMEGVSMEFARTDWQYVTNTFCFGYGVGYKFSAYEHGACNGSFLCIGADCCERAILVEDSQAPGLLITNGEFVGRWNSLAAVTIEIAPKAGGKVSLNNCSFWGPIERCVLQKSPDCQFTAIGCNFVHWDNAGKGWPALQFDAGRAIVQGNTFGSGSVHASVGQKVSSAIFMGNQASDGLNVKNAAGKRTQLIGNQTSGAEWNDKARANYKIVIGEEGESRYFTDWHGQERNPTHRWSMGVSKMTLPVVPGKEYTLTLNLNVPKPAMSPDAGVYLGGKKIAAIKKSGATSVTAKIPPSKTDLVTLELRVKPWVPAEVEVGSSDGRKLGAMGLSLTMRAKNARGAVFSGNTGEWIK